MRSKSRDTRENQRKLYDQRIQERRADLEKKGISSKELDKDKVYEHLKAKQRAIMKAIAAIDDRSARNEQHRKEAAAEQAPPAPPAPKEKKPKKEKPEKAEKAAPAKAGD